jgi:transposase-like protein
VNVKVKCPYCKAENLVNVELYEANGVPMLHICASCNTWFAAVFEMAIKHRVMRLESA